MKVLLLRDHNIYKQGDIIEVGESEESKDNLFCKVEGTTALLIVPKYICEIVKPST